LSYIQAGFEGAPVTQMIEGDRTFDVVLRWPGRVRGNEQAFLDVPLDLPSWDDTTDKRSGPLASVAPRLRLGDVISLRDDDGAAVIYHEHGQRLLAVHFRLNGTEATLDAIRKKLV